LFCTEWEAVVQTKCIRVEKGSVLVTHSGTPEEMLAANVMIETNGGVTLDSFRSFTKIPEEPTEEPQEAAAEESSGGLITQSDTLDMIFFAGFGVLLIIAFYCLYRVWKGPKEQKKLRHLNDISHVQYVTNSTAPITHTPGYYATPGGPRDPDYGYVHSDPHADLEEVKRAPYSNSFEGKYVKRSPQSSYNDKKSGFLADEEVYGYNEQHYGRAGPYDNRPQYGYGGGHADDAYPDDTIGGGATEEAFEELRSHPHGGRGRGLSL